MISKKQGRNYLIPSDEEILKINIKQTDQTLNSIITLGTKLASLLKKTYNERPELAKFIDNEVFESVIDYEDGRSCRIDTMVTNARRALHILQTHDDEIPVKKETLESLGFVRFGLWQKDCICHECILISNDERQVTEEVVELDDGQIIRRLRTVIWKQNTPSGMKSSERIYYRKLRMTKKLYNAALNTKNR